VLLGPVQQGAYYDDYNMITYYRRRQTAALAMHHQTRAHTTAHRTTHGRAPIFGQAGGGGRPRSARGERSEAGSDHKWSQCVVIKETQTQKSLFKCLNLYFVALKITT
jgi:hypothetical protein